MTAFKKKGLDRKTNHHDLTKAKTKEIFVLTKAIEERETAALKLEQSAKEVAQRPPPWRDKLQPRPLRERKEAAALEKQKGTANAQAKQLPQVNTVLPLGSLLQDLHTKVSNDATVEVVAVKAYSEWCREEAQDDSHQQETRSADNGSTMAAIENDAVQVESSETGIASLVHGIASDVGRGAFPGNTTYTCDRECIVG